ncbi:MAG: CbtB domain-containing protein [Acidimicrobiales bacterium]
MEQRLTQVPVWSWVVLALALTTVYLVTIENGAVLHASADWLHEFFHDGRHFLGVPCH